MNDRPVLFLDIDGTIAPMAPVPAPGSAYLRPLRRPTLMSVPYDPIVALRVAQIHRSGLAEIRWLTDWDAEAVTEWTAVGLGPFKHVARPAAAGDWWKTNVVRQWLRDHPRGRAVWVDDAISERAGDLVLGADEDRLLTVAPMSDVGLTANDLDLIEGWLEREARRAVLTDLLDEMNEVYGPPDPREVERITRLLRSDPDA